MSQTASDRETAQSVLQEVYAPIEGELAEVEGILHTELRSEHAYVDELVRYGCLLAGKRLRPALLLLCGRALGTVTSEHLVLAAVVEMIHAASLVHDDVLDEADTRRHLATVNSRWDNKTSVLFGDYLFTHAFYLASSLEYSRALRAIGRATNLVCEGELRQKGARGDFSLGEEQYLGIITAKTAELYACSCFLGAHLSAASEEWEERLAGFGRDLGIAFQIIDDVLDLQGDERSMGKSLGTDLEQQKPTLPVIRALQVARPADRREILAVLCGNGNHRREALAPFLERCDAFEYSYAVARSYAREASRRIFGLRPTGARHSLERISEFVISRSL